MSTDPRDASFGPALKARAPTRTAIGPDARAGLRHPSSARVISTLDTRGKLLVLKADKQLQLLVLKVAQQSYNTE